MALTPEEQRELDMLELKALEAKASAAARGPVADPVADLRGRMQQERPNGEAAALLDRQNPSGEVSAGERSLSRNLVPEALKQTALSAFPLGRISSVGKVLFQAGKQALGGAAAEEVRSLAAGEGHASAKDLATNAAVGGALVPAVAGVGAVLGKVAGKVSPEEVARVATMKLNKEGRDAALAGMKQHGPIAVVPSSVNPSLKNRLLEGTAGIQNVEAGVAEANAPVFNSVARREASMGAVDTLSKPENFEAARNRIGAVYQNTRGAGVGSFLDEWRSSATKLRAAEKALEGGYTVERGAAVDAAQKKFAESEELLELALGESGDPALVQQIRAAKTAFGKNYDVEKAVLSGTDNVRPEVLSQMLEKRGEQGLSGGLADIARFRNNLPRSAKNPANLASAPGAAADGAALIASGGDPVKAAALKGGIYGARTWARDKLVSPAYQAASAIPTYRGKRSFTPEQVAQAYALLRAAGAAKASGGRP